MNNGVIAVEKSSNKKIGDVSTTYVSQASCPNTCPFMGSGCYAESGMVGLHTRKLNKSDLDSLALAKEEANAIKSLSGKRNLRVHIVGDCKTNETAKILSDGCKEYSNKHGSKVWAYTHSFREVDRESWGNVSVLASTETTTGAKEAMAKGYAAAIVVFKYKDTKAYKENGVTVLPCPEMTGKAANCTSCKLCWDDKRLLANKMVIAFESHSQQKAKVDKSLIQIGA